MSNLILRQNLSETTVPLNIALRGIVDYGATTSIAVDVYWRFDDDTAMEPQFLAKGVTGQEIAVPFDPKGRDVRLFAVAKTSRATKTDRSVKESEQLAVDTSASAVTVSFSTQSANTIFAGPATGSPAYPSFRSMVVADLPTMTSAEFAGKISNETGSGALVFATSPALVTPALGVATATSLAVNGATIGSNAIAVTGNISFGSTGTGVLTGYGGSTIGFHADAGQNAIRFTPFGNGGYWKTLISSNDLFFQFVPVSGITKFDSYGAALSLGVTNTSVIYINTSNKVGIGNTSPAEKLSVTGNISSTGDMMPTGNVTFGASGSGFLTGYGNSKMGFHEDAGQNAIRFTPNGNGGYWKTFISSNNVYFQFVPVSGITKFDSYGAALSLAITGTDALYVNTSRNIGIGTSSISARLHLISTTEQLRIGYDASNYLSVTVNSTANVTFDLVASSGTPAFTFSDAVTFSQDVTMANAKNIVLNTSTGTKIGTAPTQKLGFWNATPVVQSAAYTVSNYTTDRTIDKATATVGEVTDVLLTLIADLKLTGIIG